MKIIMVEQTAKFLAGTDSSSSEQASKVVYYKLLTKIGAASNNREGTKDSKMTRVNQVIFTN